MGSSVVAEDKHRKNHPSQPVVALSQNYSSAQENIKPFQSPACSVHERSTSCNHAYMYQRLRPRDDHPTTPCWMVIISGVIFCLAIYVVLVKGVHNTIEHPQIRVDSVLLSPTNVSSNNQTTGNWSIGILIRNPCKHVSVVFENLEVSIFYKNTEFLSKAIVGKQFRQEPGRQTRLIVQPKTWLQGDGHSAATAIGDDDRIAEGVVDVDLKIQANSTYLHWGIGGGKENRIFHFLCKDLKVAFSSSTTDGNMLRGSKKCSVS